jgi:protein gp37
MSDSSRIEWTDATWNFLTGCSHISPGCDHCYAETLAKRLRAAGSDRYKAGFELTIHEDVLTLPLTWRRPRRIFVNSMSDFFHENVSLDLIRRAFAIMTSTPQHTYQILTKRADRLRRLAPGLSWPANVWMGVSIENQTFAFRANRLREVPAAVRFLSVEPLLGPVSLDLTGIHWVIVGGESGPGARPMQAAWACSMRDQCVEAGVAFFFKQWGGRTPKAGGRLLDGRTWDEFPQRSARAYGVLEPLAHLS